MKKIGLLLISIILLLTLTSCKGQANKKITTKTDPPNVEYVKENKNENIPVKDTNKEQAVEDKQDNEVKAGDNTKPEDPKENAAEPKVDTAKIPSNLSNEKIANWMPGRNTQHKTPVLNPKYKNILDKYDGYFTGDSSSKIIYLTFDEGYEYGLTSKILDILKDNDVKAAFFVTKPYIKSSPELVKRMIQEGHIVGNHTDKHPSMPDVSNDRIIKEIQDTSDYFKEVTGKDMPKFLRPPMGEWSERTLYITKSLGYKTILWSMAHKDWDVNNQPGKDAAYKFVDTYYHNGAILLLHPQSKSNVDALDDIIKNLKKNGYTFGTLDQLKK